MKKLFVSFAALAVLLAAQQGRAQNATSPTQGGVVNQPMGDTSAPPPADAPEPAGAPSTAPPPAAAAPPPAGTGQPGAPPPAAPPPAGTEPGPTGGDPAGGPAKRQRHTGLAVSLAFGAHGCTDRWCNDFDPLVSLALSGIYRFHEFIGAGLHVSFMFSHPEEDTEGVDSEIYWHMVIGPEIRGYFPLMEKLDVWSSLVFGYERDQADLEGKVMGTKIEQTTWLHGFALGWGIGANYKLNNSLHVGLQFFLYKPWHDEACMEIEGGGDTDKDCGDISGDDRDDVGIHWNIGLSATYFLPM